MQRQSPIEGLGKPPVVLAVVPAELHMRHGEPRVELRDLFSGLSSSIHLGGTRRATDGVGDRIGALLAQPVELAFDEPNPDGLLLFLGAVIGHRALAFHSTD